LPGEERAGGLKIRQLLPVILILAQGVNGTAMVKQIFT
jgi:hypothetical protein